MTASTNGPTTNHRHRCEPLGSTDVANLCGVAEQTVRVWRVRDVIPEPTWTVGGRPLWCRHDIERWAERTGRPLKEA